jgi:predicted acyltransferase
MAMPPQTESVPGQDTAGQRVSTNKRLISLDARRDFDMFWIIGADSRVHALNQMSQTRPTAFLAYELDHADWQGFLFYDLIFPLFVFMAGVALVFSLGKTIASAGRAEAVKRIFVRSGLPPFGNRKSSDFRGNGDGGRGPFCTLFAIC